MQRYFAFDGRQTTLRREPLGGLATLQTIFSVPSIRLVGGIGSGVFGYVVAMVARRRAPEVHPIMWALVPLLAASFASDWLGAHVV